MSNSLVTVDSVKREENEVINAIIESKGANLPDTIEEIIPMIEFSKARATAFRALCDASRKVGEQEELNRAALESGQRWGVVHLYGIRKLGEITREMPTKEQYQSDDLIRDSQTGRIRGVNPSGRQGGKREVLANQNISKANYSDAERIASHPEILERVVKTAEERGDIPTKSSVLNHIRAEQAKQSAVKEYDKARDKIVKEINRGVAEYFDAVKLYKKQLELAIDGAKRAQWFAPESVNIVKTKHSQIEKLMRELEGAI